MSEGDVETAKNILRKSIGQKALYVEFCLANECASEKALKQIGDKS